MAVGNTFGSLKPLYKDVYPAKPIRNVRVSKLFTNLKKRTGLPVPKMPKLTNLK